MATLTVTSGLSPAFASGDTVTPDKLNSLGTPTVALTAGTIVNADIGAAAAIVGSKIASNTIVNDNIKSDAAIAYSKLNLSNSIVSADLTASSVTPAKLSQPLTFASAQNASGTSVDFADIPSWARRVTVVMQIVSTNGSANVLVQLGDSAGVKNSGYASSAARAGATSAAGSSTAGFAVLLGGASDVGTFHMTITNISNNTWVSSHYGGYTNGGQHFLLAGGGNIDLTGALTTVRATTVGGTNTFDSGSINIAYEG